LQATLGGRAGGFGRLRKVDPGTPIFVTGTFLGHVSVPGEPDAVTLVRLDSSDVTVVMQSPRMAEGERGASLIAGGLCSGTVEDPDGHKFVFIENGFYLPRFDPQLEPHDARQNRP
jgi:hypothetical protein